jgi:hypothetical protein
MRETLLFGGRRAGGLGRDPGGSVYGVAEEIVVRDASGERHYLRAALDTLLGRYAGRTVGVTQVMDAVRTGALDLGIDPARPLAAYAVRDLLVAAVAMGKATVDDSCAEHWYTLEPWRER